MAQPATICTIIAKNYLAFARTLCDSFLEQHPDGRCFVLIVDDWDGFIRPAAEKFETVSLSQLGIPRVREWCFKYDVTELSTAVKPALLKYLLRQRQVGRVLYLDPDILATAPLSGLYDALLHHGVVLTPHLDTDCPEDGRLPDDAAFLLGGMYNLGFIGVSDDRRAGAFLDWWDAKLTDRCLVDPPHGYFVDQRFVDLAAVLFDNFLVEKNVGYNTAYWNIHSRRIGRTDQGRWECNGGPLYFYHFSGYKPERPQVISKHQTRFRMADRPDLEPLFALYSQRLFANGYAEASKWPYTFATYATGEPIVERTRRLYLTTPNRGEVFGEPFESPRLKAHSRAIRRVRWLRRLLAVPPAAARSVAARLIGEVP